ncbi:protein of unknown function (DUF4397) [Abditibacterium utsteinense]|uniref:DUF4397 domain-containing protein n=1 Tax=Abditibacterium utsteinense TaxID=1960156 RepID=A0A2S8SQC6_9BACT|nr:DUF4397 domain-containing protein [Abditibacterium utsteinense]PQV63007.1 protein of unknown function (DUF4397) [Abditibacterium utsteinense]
MKPFAFFSLGALLLAGCAQNTTQTASTENTNNAAPVSAATSKPELPVRGYLRALHAVPGAGTLSLSADAEKFASAEYGDATSFAAIHAERVKISAFGGDGKKVAGPMSMQLSGGEDVTILVTGIPGDIVLLPWKHKNRGPEKGKSKLAFVHSAKALPAMDLKIDGASFRRGVKFGIATDYTTLTPGKHQIQVSYDKSLAPQIVETEQPAVITKDEAGNVLNVEQPTPIASEIKRSQIVTLTQDVDLAAGKVYSLAVFTGAEKLPKVRLMEDKFAPEMVRAQ